MKSFPFYDFMNRRESNYSGDETFHPQLHHKNVAVFPSFFHLLISAFTLQLFLSPRHLTEYYKQSWNRNQSPTNAGTGNGFNIPSKPRYHRSCHHISFFLYSFLYPNYTFYEISSSNAVSGYERFSITFHIDNKNPDNKQNY